MEGVKVYGYYNAGQDCTAACRIYAGRKIYDKLVADLSDAVKRLKFNQPNDDDNDLGPLISARQQSRVESFVRRAAEIRHIEITAGGRAETAAAFLRANRGGRRAARRRNRPA